MKRLTFPALVLPLLVGCGSPLSKDAKSATAQHSAADTSITTPSASDAKTSSEVVVEKEGKGDTIELRLAPPASDSWTYRTSVETSQSGAQPFTLNTEMEQVVAMKRVQGGVEIAITVTDVSMKTERTDLQGQMDEMARMMKGIQTVAVYDLRGHTKGAKSSGGAGIPAMIAAAQAEVPIGLFGLVYPDKPVGVGAEWVGQYDMEKILQSMARASGATVRVLKGAKHPVRYHLDEVRVANGRKVALITFTLRGTTETEVSMRAMTQSGGSQDAKVITLSSINGKGLAYVDIETGMPVRVSLEQRSAAETQGVRTETTMKSVMRRED